jgi:hypothetical protein
MGRVVLLAALLYGYGQPSFDRDRPAALDGSLRDFHRAVDAAAADGRRALAMLDDARSMRYLATALRQLNDAL